MSGYIAELFGYRADDTSVAAQEAAVAQTCPFLGSVCTKRLGQSDDSEPSGVCSVCQVKDPTPVICCPTRLYASGYRLLREIGGRAFGIANIGYYPGAEAVRHALKEGGAVAVWGHGWGSELRLPKRDVDGKRETGGYFIDWVLARLDGAGQLVEFTAVEVQTIDTTGSYRASRDGLLNGRQVIKSSVGLNWENVNKRILPQIIYKGQVLQREPLCRSGLWFVTPRPVYERIEKRLGGSKNIGYGYPSQPGAIHFLRYDFDMSATLFDGAPRPLAVVGDDCTTVERVSAAFNHVVLPEPGVYEKALRAALGG